VKFCSDSFKFDISVVQCLGGYSFSGHSVVMLIMETTTASV